MSIPTRAINESDGLSVSDKVAPENEGKRGEIVRERAAHDVPYARIECTWWTHSLFRKYRPMENFVYLCLYIFCVHERRDVLHPSRYSPTFLSEVCCIDVRTLRQVCSKLVSDGDLLRRLPDGSLHIVGVRLKNVKIAWKNADPTGQTSDKCPTNVPPRARAITPTTTNTSTPPYSPPASFLEEYTEREKEIAEAAFMVVWGNVPAMSDDHKPVFVWAKLAAPKITGDPLAFLRNRYDYHHFKSPATLLEGVVNDWKIPPAGIMDAEQAKECDKKRTEHYEEEAKKRMQEKAEAASPEEIHTAAQAGLQAIERKPKQ